MHLSVYTDGASHARGGKPGGWAWVLVSAGGPIKCGSGGEPETSNNRMELTGILKALEYVVESTSFTTLQMTRLDVVSDSQYALGVSSGKFSASKNADLVKRIHEAVKILRNDGITIEFVWVRGHDGNTWNERADRLATQAKQRVMAIVNQAAVSTGSVESPGTLSTAGLLDK